MRNKMMKSAYGEISPIRRIGGQSLPDKQGYYGPFGGRFAPETLMAVLGQLENQYRTIKKDRSFQKEFEFYLKEYAGRPTLLYLAKRLSAHLKTLKVYL